MRDAESFECVEVVLFGSSVASAVRLFVLYRPPSSGRLSKPFALFLHEFGDLIIYATAKQAGLAILGDFNVGRQITKMPVTWLRSYQTQI